MRIASWLRLAVAVVALSGLAGCGGSAVTDTTTQTTGLTGLNDFVLGDSDVLVGDFRADQVLGDSKLDQYKDWVEFNSLSFGSESSGTFQSGSGGGAGKTNFSNLELSKNLDKASLKLAELNWNGDHLSKVILIVASDPTKEGRRGESYKFELTTVLVTSFQQSLVAGDVTRETIALAFAQIKITYWPAKPDGSKGDPITVDWDVAKNKPVSRAALQSIGLLSN